MKAKNVITYEWATFLIIIVGVGIRLVLLSQQWPWTDSDEGTYGIMALHIAYRGGHPIFLYGSLYMGALQAYLGAAMFKIFGPSLFALRLGLVLLFALFLLSIYLLASLLYSRAVGLLTVALLSLGSGYLLTYQLRAYGGYPETVLFGSIAFLCASWLASTSTPEISWQRLWRRCPLYIGWGLAVGLGFWSDQLILPLILTSGLLILLFCWRELLRIVPLLCVLGSTALGVYPLIYYNLHALPGQDTLSVLLFLQHGRNDQLTGWELIRQQLGATFQISLPTITGNPFCPVNDQIELRDPLTLPSVTCTLLRGGWSLSYLALFGLVLVLAVWATWQAWRSWQREHDNPEHASEARRHLALRVARLLLSGSAALAILLFVNSTATVDWPGTHARYMIGVLLAWPALLALLWRGARATFRVVPQQVKIYRIVSIVALVILGGTYLWGTLKIVNELPVAHAYAEQDQALIAHLEQLGATHIYGGYWTCDRLAFLTQEQITCDVVTGKLKQGYNRYQPYADQIRVDPRAVYVFSRSDYQAALQKIVERSPGRYRVTIFEGYYIVQALIPRSGWCHR